MITSLIANDYGKVLFEEKTEREAVDTAMDILNGSDELVAALDNPAIPNKEKHNVIDKVFPEEIRNFIKYLCDNGHINIMNDIYNVYDSIMIKENGGIKAQFYCVTEPDEKQINNIKNMIMKKYDKTNVVLEVIKDSKLIGGFILKVGDYEYDRSLKGAINSLAKKLEWR